MARDYKGKGNTRRGKSRKSASSKDDAASPLKLLLAGFSAGVIAAALAYYVLTPAPPARSQSADAVIQPRSIAEDEDVPVGGAREPQRVAAQAPAESADPAPGQPSEQEDRTEDGKKRYPFWRWLEEYEVILPEENERLEKTKPVEQVTREGRYFLQVGAFNRFADADRLKAQLALGGIETHIQRVTIDDRELHRVRIGPETDLARVNELRRRLAQQNIDVMLIRMAR